MKQCRQAGFNLIELVIFITVLSIAISSIFFAFSTSLRKTPKVNAQTTATALAQGRMEIIIGQRRMNGFANTKDICAEASPPAICNIPSALNNYSINSNITNMTLSGDNGYKLITVTVSGPEDAYVELKTVIAGY